MSKLVLHSKGPPQPTPPHHPHPAPAPTAKVAPLLTPPKTKSGRTSLSSGSSLNWSITPTRSVRGGGRTSTSQSSLLSAAGKSILKKSASASSLVKKGKKTGTSGNPAPPIVTINRHHHHAPHTLLPEVAAFEDAPEIAHLKLMRSRVVGSGQSGRSGDRSGDASFDATIATDQGQGDGSEKKFFTCFAKNKCCVWMSGLFRGWFTPPYDELDDLDPVRARTRHSLDFIQRLAQRSNSYDLISPGGQSNKTPSKFATVSKTAYALTSKKQQKSAAPVPPKVIDPNSPQSLKASAYKSIHTGLSLLHDVHHRYKQIILLLTFSRYAEQPLDEVELELSRSRTVLGSYIWLATYILEQVQYDNDVIYSGYPAGDVEEVVHNLEKIVSQSVATWEACVRTVDMVEVIHETVANVFTALVVKFVGKEEDKEVKKARHIRVHSNYQRRAAQLEKMKAEYDTRPTGVGHTWAKFSLAPLRILYKDGNKAESWRGFEMLAQVKKFALLKMLLTDASKILTIVLEQLEMVGKVLKCGEEGTPIAGLLKAKNAPISTFEQGVVDMQHYLEQFGEGGKWSQAEIKEFLEVEKITIDNLDLLTLGTATLRTLLHDARHIVHVCYELTRELDYMECRQMAVYEDVVKHHPSFGENKAGDVTISKNKTKRNSTRSDTVSIAASQTTVNTVITTNQAQNNKRKKRSAFDIEERNLDQKDVETQFDRSIYQDIIKELPVFINNLSIALTLQEAEAVFSESSHAMLSTQVHV